MHRNLIAAALAAAILPSASFGAAAAPGAATQFGKTYNMTCMIQGPGNAWIWNTYGPTIKEGTKIRLSLRTDDGLSSETTVTAYRTVKPRERIDFKLPERTSLCEARVTLPPDTGTMTTPAPWQKKLSPKARAPGA